MQVDEFLKLVVYKGATDLHLMVPSPPMLRIDGVLVPQEDWPSLGWCYSIIAKGGW